MIAMIAMSAAFMLSGAPFAGPIAGLRVGYDKDGKLSAFLSVEQLNKSKLDLVVAGTQGAIMMVEAGASEVSESAIVEALSFAQEQMQPAIALQKELAKKVSTTPQEYELSLPSETIQKEVNDWLVGKMGEKLRAPMAERHQRMHLLRKEMMAHFEKQLGAEEFSANKQEYSEAFAATANKDVRKGILEDGVRPDGRKFNEVRELSSQVGFLPRAHGSSIFTRGLTQGMNIVTLAPLSYSQVVDTMERDEERRYMHHYNAPGYTVGEIRRLAKMAVQAWQQLVQVV
jgi:polyribonucleotide nucleotidyltransferase